MLKEKTILLGVTGSIAAYKTAALASMLKKQRADVHVIMTQNACHFIHPTTFEALTGNKCLTDTFDRSFSFDVKHVSLAQRADAVMIAPASANIIGKLANGIADDMLTTTVMACRTPILLAPAMNTGMYENRRLQDNLNKFKEYGIKVVEPAEGRLACGDYGMGKMAEPEQLLQYIAMETAFPKDLQGKRILITAGPTREKIDQVRFITNFSTGKMGYALAKAAALRGAEVTLLSGPTALPKPQFVSFQSVESAEEMYQAVLAAAEGQDIIVMAAAVADYRPKEINGEKMKKKEAELNLRLERTQDILRTLGENKRRGQILCGFSMETQHLLENSRKKLQEKKLDMIVANSLREAGAGFGTDTNIVTLITRVEERKLPLMSKEEAAHEILSNILKLFN